MEKDGPLDGRKNITKIMKTAKWAKLHEKKIFKNLFLFANKEFLPFSFTVKLCHFSINVFFLYVTNTQA